MTSTSGKFFSVNRLRQATLLALFALASMQLALAGHQFDHAAGSVTESCHVCAQADRLDDLVVASAPQFTIDNADAAEQLPTVVPVRLAAAPCNYHSRAPPQL